MSKDRLVIITTNKHKIAELTPLFEEFEVSFDTSDHEKMEVRSDNVETIALEAAKHAFGILQRPLVVDDTGLFIDALKGFPRAYPAFVLETIGLQGILRLLDGVSDRRARFVTAVGYSDGIQNLTFVGEMRGTIPETPIGAGGFGYDPIFVPEGMSCTYAQLSKDEKVSISHRSRAFRQFLKWYSQIV